MPVFEALAFASAETYALLNCGSAAATPAVISSLPKSLPAVRHAATVRSYWSRSIAWHSSGPLERSEASSCLASAPHCHGWPSREQCCDASTASIPCSLYRSSPNAIVSIPQITELRQDASGRSTCISTHGRAFIVEICRYKSAFRL